MKVIFLDIDGVLNAGHHTLQWLPERMKALKAVLKETEAKIVIHSGWRTFLPMSRFNGCSKATASPPSWSST